MIAEWQTKRLVAQKLDSQHLEDICRLHRDPAVMRTLSTDGRPVPKRDTITSLEMAEDHWDRHGFGLWIFYDRANGSFVGRGGLLQYTLADLYGRQEVGLAYAVASPWWGKGMATEMAHGALSIAFGNLHLKNVASWTLPHNAASQCILTKLGFRFETDFVFKSLLHKFYNLEKDWYAEDLARVDLEIRAKDQTNGRTSRNNTR